MIKSAVRATILDSAKVFRLLDHTDPTAFTRIISTDGTDFLFADVKIFDGVTEHSGEVYLKHLSGFYLYITITGSAHFINVWYPVAPASWTGTSYPWAPFTISDILQYFHDADGIRYIGGTIWSEDEAG